MRARMKVNKLSGWWVVFAGSVAAAQQPPPTSPAPVVSILKEHVGQWRATGELVAGGRTTAFYGTRECEAVETGAGVLCRWHDTRSPDGQTHEYVEILGYDPDTGLLRSARVSETGVLTTTTLVIEGGTMRARWETGSGEQHTVAINEITVVPGGGWSQRYTVDTAGRRTMEMTIRHERLR